MGWLDWPECRNVQDVGGLPTADGRATPARALVRSGQHAALTRAGLDAVRAYGVRRIIDLRSASELTTEPSPFEAEPRYVHIPITSAVTETGPDTSAGTDGSPGTDTGVGADIEGPADLYRRFVDRCAPALGRALTAIAGAPPGPVVVHCHAGKDRTGLVVALALGAVGVTRQAILYDYVRSDTDVWSARAFSADRRGRSRVPDGVTSWLGVEADTMARTLDHLETAYGGIEPYLRTAADLDAASLTALRARLTG